MSLIPPILYAVARDGADWRGTAERLEPDADGALALAALPAPEDGQPVLSDGPVVPVAGLAISARGAIAESDPTAGAIEVVWPGCATLTFGYGGGGPVLQPGPLAWSLDDLVAIDLADGRIKRLDGWDGTLQATWSGPFTDPVGVACDSQGRVVVIDRNAPFLHRLDRNGHADAAFRAKVDAAPAGWGLLEPVAVACGAADWIIVADAQAGLLTFDGDGEPRGPIDPPEVGASPGALAAGGDRLFVHDGTAGLIHAMAAAAGQWLGALPHWRGAPAALALAPDGALWIKLRPDISRLRFTAEGAFAASGSWSLGPLDAGEDQTWHRLRIEAADATDASVSISYARTDLPAPPPTAAEFAPLPGRDAHLAVAPTEDIPPPPAPPLGRRYLWVTVTLESPLQRATPHLRQAIAQTRGEAYVDLLPGFYGEMSASGGFLDRLCDLIGFSTVGPLDVSVSWPAETAPGTAPAAALAGLAAWIDTALPAYLPVATQRELLAAAVARHLARGTRAGMADEIEVESGVAVQVRESYLDRRIWRLDEGWGLGFDTALPGADVDGLLVGGEVGEPPCPAIFPASLANTAVVGPTAGFGAALFADQAYRFMLTAPPGTDAPQLAQITTIGGRERPAHTLFGVCAAPDGLRLGDGPGLGQGLRLPIPTDTPTDDWRLGQTSRLAAAEDGPDTMLMLDGTPLAGGHYGS